MASITIKKLDDVLQSRLRDQAARHGRSMEDDALGILAAALNREPPAAGNLASSIRGRFARLGGVDLPAIVRGPMPGPVAFEE